MTRRSKPDEIGLFKKWLVERGAELLVETNSYEIVRFRAAGRAGIIYEKQNGARTLTGEALGAWADFKSRDGSWNPERRVKRKGKTGVIVRTLISRDGNSCFYCGDPFTEDKPPTREHLVSVIHDGPNHISNSFLSCQLCNTEAGHLSAPEKIRIRDRKRRGRGSLLLADLRPHVEALAVTDDDPAYKALLERVDGFLHINLERKQEKVS